MKETGMKFVWKRRLFGHWTKNLAKEILVQGLVRDLNTGPRAQQESTVHFRLLQLSFSWKNTCNCLTFPVIPCTGLNVVQLQIYSLFQLRSAEVICDGLKIYSKSQLFAGKTVVGARPRPTGRADSRGVQKLKRIVSSIYVLLWIMLALKPLLYYIYILSACHLQRSHSCID